MNYTRLEFRALMQTAEDQNIEHLDKLCTARTYTFSGKDSKPMVIPGCGNSALFSIPYSSTAKFGKPKERTVTVCAVDDNMAMWPRFGGDRFAHIEPNPEDLLIP